MLPPPTGCTCTIRPFLGRWSTEGKSASSSSANPPLRGSRLEASAPLGAPLPPSPDPPAAAAASAVNRYFLFTPNTTLLPLSAHDDESVVCPFDVDPVDDAVVALPLLACFSHGLDVELELELWVPGCSQSAACACACACAFAFACPEVRVGCSLSQRGCFKSLPARTSRSIPPAVLPRTLE